VEHYMNVWSQGLVALVLVVTAGLRVCEADEAASTGRLAAACVACHGPGGNRPVSPQTPRLAGQADDYLVEALTQYRNGARQDPVMGAMAKGLSDAQIRTLAKYFSTQPGLTVKY
jgi:cytochrome c553